MIQAIKSIKESLIIKNQNGLAAVKKVLPSTSFDSVSPQKFHNGEIHDWYRMRLGYSDHLVARLLERFDIKAGQNVIDPFCGSGTTLVECMKRGIGSIGIDANPSSCFSARVKTNWSIKGSRLLELLEDLTEKQKMYLRRKAVYKADQTYKYIEETGMLSRGWISPEPLRKAIAIKTAICDLRTIAKYRDALMLALIAEVIEGASNVKFGPELYCGPIKPDADVFLGFSNRVKRMASDINIVESPSQKARVIQGDSRLCDRYLKSDKSESYVAVVRRGHPLGKKKSTTQGFFSASAFFMPSARVCHCTFLP